MHVSWDIVTTHQGWPPAIGKYVRVTFDLAASECTPAALTTSVISQLTSNIPYVGSLVAAQFLKSSKEIIEKNKGYGVVVRVYMPIVGVGVAYNEVSTKSPTESIVNGPFSNLIVEEIDHADYSIVDSAGWKRLIVDLNMGARGPFLYLKCKPWKQEDGQPICDVIVLASGKNNITTPAGYEKVLVDLNKGVGGDYIYLYFRRGQSAINSIAVVAGDKSSVPPPAGFHKLGVDLNKGAKGKYIYLCLPN